ncbi:putative ATP-dependent RNA helicase DHR1 [Tulasnella sp. 330]|nr:putative ATP-dependent RNA helicase DHR1 [Tulasnella sp. 330]
MGPPQRIRYNTKARGGKSHKKRGLFKKPKKNAVDATSESEVLIQDIDHQDGECRGEEGAETEEAVGQNSGFEVIISKTAAQKEQDRKERMMQEMMDAHDQSNWNRKRKKKLEAYIAKKVKREERIRLFERLSQSQADIDHLKLQSSSTLGSGRSYTHAHRLALEQDQEFRRVVGKRKRLVLEDNEDTGDEKSEANTSDPSRKVKMARFQEEDSNCSDEWKGIDTGCSDIETQEAIGSDSSALITALATSSPALGAALRRNPDGTAIAPRMAKRKARIKKPVLESDVKSESSVTSFDSSASSYRSESSEDMSGDDADNNHGGHSFEEDGTLSETRDDRSQHTSGFKDWALKQVIAAKSGVETEPTTTLSSLPTEYYRFLPNHLRPKPVSLDPKDKLGPLGEKLVLPDTVLAKHLASKNSGDVAESNGESSSDVLSEIDTGTASDTQSERGVEEIDGDPSKPKNFVTVIRSEEVIESRLRLPILAEEQIIIETILLNPVTIVCGETGSGKTTQVPQFLFEAGFGSPGSENPGMIGITQPRRVAAMSMASRVAHELSLPARRVSHQIRYDATVSPETSIKFMTDGVLLRELARDFLLTRYSVIIVDEAHERSMNTDVLIGVLSRVLKLRENSWKLGHGGIKPLRLIIMSATLRVADFRDNKTLFPTPPPLINVDFRQFPVTMHYNRRTTHDYMNEVVKKATKIHCRLPPGGILIFLTGQDEIHTVCRKLGKRFGAQALELKRRSRETSRSRSVESDVSGRDVEPTKPSCRGPKGFASTPVAAREGVVEADEVDIGVSTALDRDALTDASGDGDRDELDSDSGSGTRDEKDDVGMDSDYSDVPMHILPLYSLLPVDRQMQVFVPPPIGSRLVVVATNVAETSLTIPGISYVVDAGRAKQRHHDVRSGIESFSVGWISKASSAQRAGRAGRTGPGHCYRLYSSAFYESHFKKFDEPEILRMPIEGVVLQMKSMHIDAVINFPFPTPPNRDALRQAEKLLTHLGALESPETTKGATSNKSSSLTTGGRITDLGRAMALFPVSPRYSKMLVIGQQQGCLPYVIALVAAMSVGDPFLREENIENDDEGGDSSGDEGGEAGLELSSIKSDNVREKEGRRLKRRAFFKSQAMHMKLGSSSDAFRMLSVVGAYEYEGRTAMFCQNHFVRPKAMEEIHKLRAQISYIVQANFPAVDAGFNPKLPPPAAIQLKALRQFLTAGFIDHIAARKDVLDKRMATGTKVASSRGVSYRAMGIEEDVYIHPSSTLFQQAAPEWIVYQDVVRTSKVWLRGVTVINPAWLPTLGPSLCTFSKPLDLPASAKKLGSEVHIVTPHFGPQRWCLPSFRL